MPRVLQNKEKKVLDMFARVKPVSLDAATVSFTANGDIYNSVDPVVYTIPGTDSILVFGDLRKSLSMEQMKEWLAKQIELNKSKDASEAIKEIDGDEDDEHGCGAGCGHDHSHPEAHAEQEVLEIKNEGEFAEEDINLIVAQTSVSREEAIEALRKSDNDVVCALVELTKKK
ncbi:nascent polypeptide-associated complex subunit alpha [Enteropsectra breve]|nr:nascent polypeptide-associated complex subunit alpha [Enteropsectra breve]